MILLVVRLGVQILLYQTGCSIAQTVYARGGGIVESVVVK